MDFGRGQTSLEGVVWACEHLFTPPTWRPLNELEDHHGNNLNMGGSQIKVYWAFIIQQRVNEEIQVRRAYHPTWLYLYSSSSFRIYMKMQIRKLNRHQLGNHLHQCLLHPYPQPHRRLKCKRQWWIWKSPSYRDNCWKRKNKLKHIQEKNAKYL